MVRCEAAREFRLRLPDCCEIEVLLVRPLPNLSHVALIDLDFVMDLIDGQGGPAYQYENAGSDKPGRATVPFQIQVHPCMMLNFCKI
jgi:hypothetical protein